MNFCKTKVNGRAPFFFCYTATTKIEKEKCSNIFLS